MNETRDFWISRTLTKSMYSNSDQWLIWSSLNFGMVSGKYSPPSDAYPINDTNITRVHTYSKVDLNLKVPNTRK